MHTHILQLTSIHHGGGEDGQHCVLRVQHSFLQHGVVLLDADGEGDVVSLCPSSQGVEEEDGLLVTTLSELGLSVLEGGGRRGSLGRKGNGV